jgi:hypothetical protein
LGGVVTIGIAAHGPNAGLAVLRALAAVEGVGRGAICGFVSFVALTPDGAVRRLAVQRGGTAALFDGGLAAAPDKIGGATTAGLMSSGPDRPEPLSQFTPALAGVGLVTGHRMPNTIGMNGVNLNDEVLELVRRGASPEEAVDRVVVANPDVDAGIIALGADGRAHAANTAHVQKRGDAGRALIGSRAEGAVVAVLHNAIRPHRPIAALAAEVAMDVMKPEDRPDGWITFREGVRLIPGPANAVDVDANGAVKTIVVENPRFLKGIWSLGIGYETRVLRQAQTIAAMLYEPYMVVDGGRLQSIDGQSTLSVPIRMH